jgi:hypothetical protein
MFQVNGEANAKTKSDQSGKQAKKTLAATRDSGLA